MFVYADHAATTKISNEALAEMNSVYGEFFGNPSSLHTPGQKAAENCCVSAQYFTSVGKDQSSINLCGIHSPQK